MKKEGGWNWRTVEIKFNQATVNWELLDYNS